MCGVSLALNRLDKSDFTVQEEEQAPLDYDLVQEVRPEDLKDVMAVHVELENEHYHTCQRLGIALSDGVKTQYIPFDKRQNQIFSVVG